MDEPADPGVERGLQQGLGAQDVGDDEVRGAGDRTVDVRLGGEVDDGVVAGHEVVDEVHVADVALDEAVARGVGHLGQVRQRAGVGELVQDGDLGPGRLRVGVGELPAHVVRADEPGRAGDKDLHGSPLLWPAWQRHRRLPDESYRALGSRPAAHGRIRP